METFVLTFGLHKNMITDRPFIVRCDLSIDSEDLSIISRLTCGQQTPENFPDGVQGMLQIKSFTPLDSSVAMDARRWKIWEQAKMKHHAFQALNKKPPGPIGKNATGLIDFHMEGDRPSAHVPPQYL